MENIESLVEAALSVQEQMMASKDQQLAQADELERLASKMTDVAVESENDRDIKAATIAVWRETAADIRHRHTGERPKTAKQLAEQINEQLQRNAAIMFESPDLFVALAHASFGQQDRLKKLIADMLQTTANNIASTLEHR